MSNKDTRARHDGRTTAPPLIEPMGVDVLENFTNINRRAGDVTNRALRALQLRMRATEASDHGMASDLSVSELVNAAKMGIAATHSQVRIMQSERSDSAREAFLAAVAEAVTGNLPTAAKNVTPYRLELEAEKALIVER